MNKEDKNTEEEITDGEGAKSFTYLYIAIGCFAAACALFALALGLTAAHVIKDKGVYLLIASMLCALAAMSFINAQKRKAVNKLCKIMQVLNYVILFANLAVFVIGVSMTKAE